jgi:uncharacterized membrane protein
MVSLLRHGEMMNSIRGLPWLGDHASLILFLLAPIVWLTRTASTLLVLQTLAIAAGAIPVYRLARLHLRSRDVALVFAACYLLYPATGFVTRTSSIPSPSPSRCC